MLIPSPDEAGALLQEARERNPTPWVEHCRHVAAAAEAIAECHGGLDPGRAKILGLLHDIGRRDGVTDMRHTLDGFTFLNDLGFADAARICLTHSFPLEDLRRTETAAGKWDCTYEEVAFVDRYLADVEYDDYDRLIQLCDALALPVGFCSLERRFVDVVIRHGFNDYTVPRWKAYLGLMEYFEKETGRSLYRLLPVEVDGAMELD
jgi:hypothetical protein